MQRLRFKEYLFYDEFCYIKFKNKEFGLLEDLKRYLYKHPFNVNHYEIQIVNTNVRNLYSEKDFFDRLYNLDIENFLINFLQSGMYLYLNRLMKFMEKL